MRASELRLLALVELRTVVDREMVVWMCDGLQWLRGRRYKADEEMRIALDLLGEDIKMGIDWKFDLAGWIHRETEHLGSPVRQEVNGADQPITHMARLAWLDKMIYDLENEHATA